MLRNHGPLTVGDSVERWPRWFLSMERCCQVRLAAKAAGRPVLIDHRRATAAWERLGGDLVAWINYRPPWREVSRDEPDPLE